MDQRLRQQFWKPDPEFTLVPFWFWNDDMEENELKRQIADFAEKGVHAFVIHPRIGIPAHLEYLSERFMELVKCAVEEAARLGMKVVLYDEGMYPSGSAHGLVAAENPLYKSRGLRRVSDISGLSVDEVVLYEQDGIYYTEGFTEGTIRGIHFGEDDGEAAAPKSSDLLNKEAVECFIRLTYDAYFRVLGEYFGNTIIGFFTDEPSIVGRCVAKDILPWGANFMDFYVAFGGDVSDLPKLWETGSHAALYQDALIARLEETYYKPISDWCGSHGIALMGHPERADDIGMQKYFHIPGQDLVFRWVAPDNGTSLTGEHSTQAKCTSDAARHAGRRRNSNECFGACNREGIPWHLTGSDIKWYIDWLCVRGVNMLIPHAFYYSIEGERKFERPPDVGPHNIWWEDYHLISTYSKRLCWLMTDSANTADVAVFCNSVDLDFVETAVLYQNQVEFNYLQDSYIVDKNIRNGYIQVNQNQYSVLLVPGDIELVAEKEKTLKENGVRVVKTAEEAIELATREICCGQIEPHLRFSHILKQEKSFYLFVNEGECRIETDIVVRRVGHCEFWNPWNGDIRNADVLAVYEGSMRVMLHLNPRESVILYLDESIEPEIVQQKTQTIRRQTISNGEFMLAENDKQYRIILHLGDPQWFDCVRLFVNGKFVETKMWLPYSFEITDFVWAGHNRVEIIEKKSKAYEYGGLVLESYEEPVWVLEFQLG